MARKRSPAPRKSGPPAPTSGIPWAHAALAGLAALVAALYLYAPALHAPFFFDDHSLIFQRGVRVEPLRNWISLIRPVLNVSYWLNYQWSGDDPFSYHVLNVFIHALNSALIFLMLFRLLALAGWEVAERRAAAFIGAAVFLVHPLETESVSYIAGRSESLAAFFMLGSYVAFLYRPEGPVSWKRAAAVLGLAALAAASKENAVAVAGLWLLTDLIFGGGLKAIKANWRLYLPMLPIGAVAGVAVSRILAQSQSAGFSEHVPRWYQYALTEARAIFTYLRMALLPFGQSVDQDYPISRLPLDHGAIFFVALLALLVAVAWRYRRRFPLAVFGFLMFLVLLAPTSSVVPIADPLVERRMYLPLAGLVLCALALGRWAPVRRAVPVVCTLAIFLFAVLCYQRNQLWSSPEQMWISAAYRSHAKPRPYLHLTELLIFDHRCQDAFPYLERAERLMPANGEVQIGWARVLECLDRRDEALARLQKAAQVDPTTSVYQWLGLLEGEMGRTAEAGAALRKAVDLRPDSSAAHSALGLWYESTGDTASARREYQKALGLDSYSDEARAGLARVSNRAN